MSGRMDNCWINTYEVVNTTSGKSGLLLKDDVCRTTGGFMSNIRWVGYDARMIGRSEVKSEFDEASDDYTRLTMEYVERSAALVRRFSHDAKAYGSTLIFVDLGPNSIENNAPGLFRQLIEKASEGGIRVRGVEEAIVVEDKSVRDKQTGEPGVVFRFTTFDIEEDGEHTGTGCPYDTNGKLHRALTYRLYREGAKWIAR